MSLLNEFTKGIIKENPLFRLVLGTCPSLAITTSVDNGLGMGAAFTVVLLGSNIVISAMRKIIPESIRIPVYIVIIASFVTMIDLLMHAYTPAMYKALGIFIPLIVVNCIIIGRAEAFANRNSIVPSILDALGMGVGFTLALVLLCTFREVLGAGTFLGFRLLPESKAVIMMILPPGGFVTLGCILGFLNKMQGKTA
jgi:electron transport complex protein RnfE